MMEENGCIKGIENDEREKNNYLRESSETLDVY